MRLRYFWMLTAFFICGCRSEADRMAEFCLNFEAAVTQSADCAEMAERVGAELDRTIRLDDDRICKNTTACLPCKAAIPDMLRRCGYDENFTPVLRRMSVSRILRDPGE